MANLLPTAERQSVRKERYKRLYVCILVGVLVTLTIGSVLLIPAYMSGASRQRSTEERLDAIRKLIALKQGSSADTSIVETQNRLETIDALLSVTPPSQILTDTTRILPPGVTLWQYIYTRTPEGARSITISGRSTTREALLRFGDALRASGLFVTVDIPISTLARSTNIVFTLTMALSEERDTGAQLQ